MKKDKNGSRSLPQVEEVGVEPLARFANSTRVVTEARGLQVPARQVALSGGEPPFTVYDTAGPEHRDYHKGLPRLRQPWIDRRLQGGDSGNRTQMHYARRGIVTEEMYFAALREGMD